MLETVRIRRAGYNVRLTYEEFIQLYRILLPKGLVSSQKDVRDFMNTMELNKQHYQLGKHPNPPLHNLTISLNIQTRIRSGISKIYMRESQKMRLDIRLHTKIIDSIVMIQRWFRCLLQRRKYTALRTAALTIQSNWRQYLSNRQSTCQKTHANAAIVIQSAWRMYITHKWYSQLIRGVIIVQAHIRGKLTRIHIQKTLARIKQKQNERHKLRPTQSLPTTEK